MAGPSFDGAIAFAQDLIRIPSLPGQEGPLTERVLQEMRDLGYDQVYADEMGNAVGVIQGPGGASVMLSAHLDMVAEGDPEEWEYPPFGAVIDGGYLHGRGAMDIKGPLAIQTHVGAALRGQVPGDLIVAHPVFEERGGWGMDVLTRPEGGLRPDVVVIGESTHGDVAIGHRGRAEVEIVLHGLAGHASAPDRARNALDLLPAVLRGVEDLQGDQGEDPVLGRSSVVATDVTAMPASRNVIPDLVVVSLDWRILPTDDEASLLRRVRTAIQPFLDARPHPGMEVEVRMAKEVQRTYTGIEEERQIFSPGFLMDRDHPVVTAAAEAVGPRNGQGGAAQVRPWTFATDGGWTCGVRGIPTIGFAPGEERHAHTNTERLSLEEAEWGYARYLELVPAVAEAAAG